MPMRSWRSTQPLVEPDRRLGVGGALHVQPEPGPALVREGRERPSQSARQASPLWSSPSWVGLIETSIRPVRVRPTDVPLDDVAVVRGDVVGLCEGVEVLAEVREQHADALVLEPRRGRERVVDPLAGHEATHGPAGERQAWQGVAQPLVPGHPEERGPHQSHAAMVPLRTCLVAAIRRNGHVLPTGAACPIVMQPKCGIETW